MAAVGTDLPRPGWGSGDRSGALPLELENIRVLVVEDDPIIGLDLSDTIAAAGAFVLGPAPDVRSALTLLEGEPVDAAVLDHVLVGGDSRPIADLLLKRGIAFLFHTSHRSDLATQYPSILIIEKPSHPDDIVRSLKALFAKSA
jgi:DNA-binding response OmpR family regulator